MKYEIHKAFVGVGAAVIAISLIVLVVRMNFHEHPHVGTRILPALNVNEVANIECDGRKLASHHDGKWVIDAYDGYPADPTKVDSFLCALTNLTVWKVEEDTNICRRVMYNPLSIVLKDADGNVLADLELGEKHGVGHSGFVESVFVPDGRYMSFMGETVVVREQFRMFWGRERSLAEPYDVEMPEMLIRREVCHVFSFLSILILLSHSKLPVCRDYDFNWTIHVGRVMIWGNRILRENEVQAILANIEVLG